MAITIVIPDGAQYVAASILSTVFLTTVQGGIVGSYRKAAGIKYPRAYAEKAEMEANRAALQFNCAQRAHQNTLEVLPTVLTTTLLTALQWPTFAASALGVWSAARVLYTLGYVTGDPDKRNTRGGFMGSISMLSLICSASYSVFKLVTA
jgi:glutathione S-transferase